MEADAEPRLKLTRRRVVLGVIALGAVLEAAIAVAVLANGGSGAPVARATPLHPVAGSFKPDETRLDECSDQGCFEQAFGNIAFYRSSKEAMTLLEATRGDRADTACHRIVHTIGSASLVRNNGNVARTFAEGDSTCFSGYYHGVLERSLVGVKSRTARGLARVARSLCAGVSVDPSLWLRLQCLHGLGHGLMITSGYALPLSLAVCDRLQTGWAERSCNGGVFMENLGTSYGVASRWLRDDDPLYPCTAVADEDKRACFDLVTTQILRTVDGDFEKAAKVCSQVQQRWEGDCFRSLGRDAVSQVGDRPADVLPLCAVARQHGRENECVRGAAVTIAANYKSGVQAAALCRAAPRAARQPCFFGTGSLIVRFLGEQHLRTACSAIAGVGSDASACVRGARHYLGVIARES
jgi:hypothetical protein